MVWPDFGQNNLYSDLMLEFVEQGHEVFVATLTEKRKRIPTQLISERGMKVLYVKCDNIQKVNKYSKVLNSFFAGFFLRINTINKLKDESFNCIIYALPPLTISPFVISLKKYFQTSLYLLLKEFWPQDPVDLGAMRKGGIVWIVFRYLEKRLYKHCNYIGTMSKAGIKFIKEHYPNIKAVIEECPNSEKAASIPTPDIKEKTELRRVYGIPYNSCVFVFGGNLGLSQGIDEMINEIKAAKIIDNVFFMIIGSGTEYEKIKNEFDAFSSNYIKVIPSIPRDEFDRLLACCDVGMLFLSPNYTVPNVPSRLVSYLKVGLPILAAIDRTSDVGSIIEEAKCGISIINGDIPAFLKAIESLTCLKTREAMSINSRRLFLSRYSTSYCYKTIIKHFQ